jgi:hypothetical protein
MAKRTAKSPSTGTAAKSAAAKHAERLRKLGAHAISIKPGKGAASGHVIEVYVPDGFTGTLPERVTTTVRGKKVTVLVTVKKSPKFKAEKL